MAQGGGKRARQGAAGAARSGRGKFRRKLPEVHVVPHARGQALCDVPRGALVGLSAEQAYVVRSICGGHNVFMTGPGGTGKTHTIRALVRILTNADIPVAVTAASGIAATHIEGRTLHSWAGLGRADEDLAVYLQRVQRWKTLRDCLRRTRVLIVDEVSMLQTPVMVKLDAMCAAARGTHAPLGGIVLLLSGDFFQLPPVVRDAATAPTPLYASDWWKYIAPRFVELSTSYRQQQSLWAGLLNRMRVGAMTASDHAVLQRRVKPRAAEFAPREAAHAGPPVETALHATRRAVGRANAVLLQKCTRDRATLVASLRLALRTATPPYRAVELTTPSALSIAAKRDGLRQPLLSSLSELTSHECEALARVVCDIPSDAGTLARREALKALADCTVQAHVTLAVGMPVVLLANISRTLVNGSQGRLVGWTHVPCVQCTFGGVVPVTPQTPMATWDATNSHVRCARFAPLEHWQPKPMATREAHAAYQRRLSMAPDAAVMGSGATTLVPVVEFQGSAHEGQPVAVMPHFFSRRIGRTPKGVTLWAGAWQTPLAAAGALTIHKAQGMSLSRAYVDPDGIFEEGQLYVAVSRVRTLEGLTLASYSPDCVRVNGGVCDWYTAQRAKWLSVRDGLPPAEPAPRASVADSSAASSGTDPGALDWAANLPSMAGGADAPGPAAPAASGAGHVANESDEQDPSA